MQNQCNNEASPLEANRTFGYNFAHWNTRQRLRSGSDTVPVEPFIFNFKARSIMKMSRLNQEVIQFENGEPRIGDAQNNNKRPNRVTATLDETNIKGILLYSLDNSLQTGLLASLITEKSGRHCEVVHKLDPETVPYHLLLIDCQGHAVEELRTLIGDIHQNAQPLYAALINARQNSEHEELLDWPCISGLFFVDTDQEQLLRGLECLIRGEYWVPRRLLHHFLQKNRRAPQLRQNEIKLTKRERQILRLIKDGATNQDISTALQVSEHTVKSHLYNVYKKIGVRNRLEASNWVRDLEEL